MAGRQEGYTLLLAMIFIVVLTVFGINAMNGSIMQIRMAGNYRDAQVAAESAESGLRWGETWLQSRGAFTRPFPCQTLATDLNQNCASARQVLDANLLVYNLADLDPWTDTSNWNNARPFGYDPATAAAVNPAQTVPKVYRQPQILLEQTFVDRDDLAGRPSQGRVFYRIVAAGNGARPSTVSVLESSVAKRYE